MSERAIQKYSAGLRVWHWLDAVVVTALLLTFFLRETLLAWRTNAPAFVAKLGEHQILASEDAAKDLNRILIDHLWDWHIKLGYVLTALLLWRVILIFTDRMNPFGRAWTSVSGLRSGLDFRSLHTAGVKLSYAAFYGLQILMVLTGLSMVFSGELGLSEAMGNFAGEVHENVMWFFAAFVVAHIAGIFFAENTTDPGIVSDMINGGKGQRL